MGEDPIIETWIMCSEAIHGRVLINSLDPQSIVTQSTLHLHLCQHSLNILGNSWSRATNLKIGEYPWIFPSFSWGIFAHMTCLHQSRASENI